MGLPVYKIKKRDDYLLQFIISGQLDPHISRRIKRLQLDKIADISCLLYQHSQRADRHGDRALFGIVFPMSVLVHLLRSDIAIWLFTHVIFVRAERGMAHTCSLSARHRASPEGSASGAAARLSRIPPGA